MARIAGSPGTSESTAVQARPTSSGQETVSESAARVTETGPGRYSARSAGMRDATCARPRGEGTRSAIAQARRTSSDRVTARSEPDRLERDLRLVPLAEPERACNLHVLGLPAQERAHPIGLVLRERLHPHAVTL